MVLSSVKFFLNLSAKEQKKRFLDRINDPDKNWKFSASDAKERKFWDDYMDAYEELIRHTSTKESPWYVVPADNKAFSRVVVASAIINAMDSLDLKYPKGWPGKISCTGRSKKGLDERRLKNLYCP